MQKKINWILILQGWAMLWVVIGHSFVGDVEQREGWPSYMRLTYDFAYSFHMPLFMFISGYLFYMTRIDTKKKVWAYKDIVVDKAQRLLIPGAIFSVIAFGLKILFPGEVSRELHLNLSEIIHIIMYPFDNPLREVWFLITLFWYFVLTPLWKLTMRNNTIIFFTMVMLVILFFYHPDIKLLCVGRVFYYAIWFYSGMILCRTNAAEGFISNNKWMTLLLGVAVYALASWISPFFTRVGGILFSLALALLLDKYFPSIFKTFRNYTYQIFLIGIFPQMFIKIVGSHIHLPVFLIWILCIAVGLYIPVLISLIIGKSQNTLLLSCLGLKPKHHG